jgi:drug/metabolite transporter (DMT)-like permease
VLAAAALFSTGGALIKATRLSAWQVACLRSLFAACALLLLVPATRRRWTPRMLLVACAYAATLILFVASNKLTTSANAIFLQSTAPLYLLLLGPLVLEEPVRRRDVALLAAIAAGMALCFLGTSEPHATAPNPRLGDLLAAASGLSWALTVTGLRWMARGEAEGGEGAGAAVASTLTGNVVACVACLPFALPLEGVRGVDWGVVAFLGTFQIALAYACLTAGMRRVRALEGSLLLLLEPVLNPVWSWLVHDERPSPLALGGAGVILGATTLHAATLRRREADAG